MQDYSDQKDLDEQEKTNVKLFNAIQNLRRTVVVVIVAEMILLALVLIK